MPLYGDQLAEFNSLVATFQPKTNLLMQQNDAIGATLNELGLITTQLATLVAAGDVPVGHLERLQSLIANSVNPAKVSKMVQAVTLLAGLSPGLVLCTDDNGDGSVLTPVAPAP